MKLTLWQQFSSNHSADFLLIGTFKTVDDAQQVAEEIRSILLKVARWREQVKSGEMKPPSRYFDLEDTVTLTPIEESMRDEYGIVWLRTIDYARNSSIVAEAVRVFDRTLLVSEHFINAYTWTSADPFPELVEKLGGEVALYSETRGSHIVGQVSAVAPNEAAANQLTKAVTLRLYQPHGHTEMMLPSVFDEFFGGNMVREGMKFTFDDIYVYPETFDQLVRLMKFLEARGFHSIEYEFKQGN